MTATMPPPKPATTQRYGRYFVRKSGKTQLFVNLIEYRYAETEKTRARLHDFRKLVVSHLVQPGQKVKAGHDMNAEENGGQVEEGHRSNKMQDAR